MLDSEFLSLQFQSGFIEYVHECACHGFEPNHISPTTLPIIVQTKLVKSSSFITETRFAKTFVGDAF